VCFCVVVALEAERKVGSATHIAQTMFGRSEMLHAWVGHKLGEHSKRDCQVGPHSADQVADGAYELSVLGSLSGWQWWAVLMLAGISVCRRQLCARRQWCADCVAVLEAGGFEKAQNVLLLIEHYSIRREPQPDADDLELAVGTFNVLHVEAFGDGSLEVFNSLWYVADNHNVVDVDTDDDCQSAVIVALDKKASITLGGRKNQLRSWKPGG
jgi:hypothetical protein